MLTCNTYTIEYIYDDEMEQNSNIDISMAFSWICETCSFDHSVKAFFLYIYDSKGRSFITLSLSRNFSLSPRIQRQTSEPCFTNLPSDAGPRMFHRQSSEPFLTCFKPGRMPSFEDCLPINIKREAVDYQDGKDCLRHARTNGYI